MHGWRTRTAQWHVPSQSGHGSYRVTLAASAPSCPCDDFQLHRRPCKHVIAAQIVCARDHGGRPPRSSTDTVPARPTYGQDWPLYNEAQQTEKYRFRALLFELCRGLPDPPQTGPGRRRTAMADMVFACALKVFTTLSSRRFACDLGDAHALGYLSHLMNSVSVCAYLENDLLTPVLQELVVRSSLPLRAVETVFAPDSSGFSTSRFVRWFDEKYGVRRSEHDWVKAHIMTGVKTNIVTAVEIHGRDAADSPLFKPLVETTAENFTVKEVPADKAYSSQENVEAVDALGGMAAIAVQVERHGRRRRGLREDVPLLPLPPRGVPQGTTTSGRTWRAPSRWSRPSSATPCAARRTTAMKNEVLCKFLCHNLCVVHQSQIELGIEPIFWADETEPEGEGRHPPLETKLHEMK